MFGRRIREKSIHQNQQFVESLAELSEIMRIPFISDDVCCYSQPSFDEAAKLFHFLLLNNKLLVLKNIFFSNSMSQDQNLHAVSNQITSKTIFAMFVALD